VSTLRPRCHGTVFAQAIFSIGLRTVLTEPFPFPEPIVPPVGGAVAKLHYPGNTRES
jgi:hypothetical protein